MTPLLRWLDFPCPGFQPLLLDEPITSRQERQPESLGNRVVGGVSFCHVFAAVPRYNGACKLLEARVSETIIRPTMKFIFLGYVLVVVIVAVAVGLGLRMAWPAEIPPAAQTWLPWLPTLLLLWPLKRHLRNRLTRMTILEDRLRYETGLLGKTTRTILISRVQDVTVHQSVGQRIFRTGDLSIETAGGSSRETIFNIDNPQEVADRINQLSATAPTSNPSA